MRPTTSEQLELAHELALIENEVRTDLSFIDTDLRDLTTRTDFTRGFDAAVLAYAKRLGLITEEQINDNGWFV